MNFLGKRSDPETSADDLLVSLEASQEKLSLDSISQPMTKLFEIIKHENSLSELIDQSILSDKNDKISPFIE